MQPLLEYVLPASVHAAALGLIVWGITAMMRDRLTAGARYALWAMVILRLLTPALPSRYSLLNLWPSRPNGSPAESVTFSAPPADANAPIAAARTEVLARTQPPRQFQWGFYLMSAWLLGALVLAAAGFSAIFRFQRRVKRCGRVIDDIEMIDLLAECCERMKVRRRVEMRETGAVATPALAGIFRPAVLFPNGMLPGLSRQQVRMVILHELAHLRRHDIAVDRVLAIIASLHWFNPLAHLAISRLRGERELLRDASVVNGWEPTERMNYGRTLLALAQYSPGRWAAGAVGIVEPKWHLRQRIRAVAEHHSASAVAITMSALMLLATAYLMLGGRTPEALAGEASPTTTPAQVTLESPADYTFNQRPFSSAVADIAQRSKLMCVIDADALKAAGISADAPVTATYHATASSEVLKQVLLQASNDHSALEFSVQGGAVLISTHDGFATTTTDTRVYDIRDLMYPINGEVQVTIRPGERGKASPAVRDPTESDRVAQRIKKTVAPETWDNSRKITKFNNGQQLIIEQTPLRHRQIAALLEDTREKRALQVSVQMWFIHFPADLAARDPAFRGLAPGNHRIVSDLERNAMIRAMQKSQGASILTAPRLTLSNNTYAEVTIGQQNAYVQAFVPNEKGFPTAKPGMFETGVKATMHCKVSEDHKSVATDGDFNLLSLLELKTLDAPNAPQFSIQLPVIYASRNHMSTVIPDGQTFALAAAPCAIEPKDAKTDKSPPNEQLFILIKATIIEPRESNPRGQ